MSEIDYTPEGVTHFTDAVRQAEETAVEVGGDVEATDDILPDPPEQPVEDDPHAGFEEEVSIQGTEERERERARDDKGRFVPDQLLAGKYKDAEQLERSYLEQQSELGRLRNELGQLRDAFEQPRHATDYSQLIEANPAAAAEAAYRDSNPQAMAAAFETWKLEDEAAAYAWRSDKILEQRMNEINERINAVTEPLEQRSNDMIAQQQQQELLRRHPDLNSYADEIERLVDEQPIYRQFLEAADPVQRIGVFEGILQIAKSRIAATHGDAERTVARETHHEADLARQEAAVVTAARTAGESPGEELDEGEEFSRDLLSRWSDPAEKWKAGREGW